MMKKQNFNKLMKNYKNNEKNKTRISIIIKN